MGRTLVRFAELGLQANPIPVGTPLTYFLSTELVSPHVQEMDPADKHQSLAVSQGVAGPVTAFHCRWGLRPVLNAYDKSTALGGARVLPAVAHAVAEALPEVVEMDALQEKAGALIARLSGSEAGAVTHCAAAAITVNIAACMTGCDRDRVARLPDTTGMVRRVLIQKGHCISFGVPVAQMIRLAGAELVEVGDESGCPPEAMQKALATGDTAAVFAVESYHTVDYNGLSLAELVPLCRAAKVPLVVDAATQELRLAEIIAQGPDLVGCSAQKYFQSLTAGVIAGRADLVRAVNLQQLGIGRPMKPTKEALVALMAALQHLEQSDRTAWQKLERDKIETFGRVLQNIPGVELAFSPDPNGCPVTRLRLRFDPSACAWDAATLREALLRREPAVVVRIYGYERDAVYLNATELTAGECQLAAEIVRSVLLEGPAATGSHG